MLKDKLFSHNSGQERKQDEERRGERALYSAIVIQIIEDLLNGQIDTTQFINEISKFAPLADQNPDAVISASDKLIEKAKSWTQNQRISLARLLSTGKCSADRRNPKNN